MEDHILGQDQGQHLGWSLGQGHGQHPGQGHPSMILDHDQGQVNMNMGQGQGQQVSQENRLYLYQGQGHPDLDHNTLADLLLQIEAEPDEDLTKRLAELYHRLQVGQILTALVDHLVKVVEVFRPFLHLRDHQ